VFQQVELIADYVEGFEATMVAIMRLNLER